MNRYAQMISELKTPEVMKRLTYLYGQRVQVDGSGQYLAPVMVGVIAADFGAPRRADHGDGAFIADKLFMPLE